MSARLGRRGAFLLLVGTMWCLYGYGLATGPTPAARKGLGPLLGTVPLRFWAALWLVGGALALIAAPVRIPGRDTFGFVGLVTPALLWTLLYLTAWWPLGAYPKGWVSAAIWGVAAVAVVIVAGWDEPNPKPGA